MSLREQLESSDDGVRLAAADAAAVDGGPELIELLLDLALHDPAEVQTTGGVAEVWRKVGAAAAQGLRGILDRLDGLDDRVLAAVTDPAEDDERAGRLLYYLGERYEPVRRDLETNADGRLRLRALHAVLAHRRPAALNRRFLAAPAAAVRVEVLQGGTGLEVADVETLLHDPDPRVRRAAVKWLRWADSPAFVAAARRETDRTVRQAFVDGLVSRPLTPPVRDALVGYLADDDGYTEDQAAARLRQADDPGVAAAIASRILVRGDGRRLTTLVRYPYLLKYAPSCGRSWT